MSTTRTPLDDRPASEIARAARRVRFKRHSDRFFPYQQRPWTVARDEGDEQPSDEPGFSGQLVLVALVWAAMAWYALWSIANAWAISSVAYQLLNRLFGR
jgi:hypothetical protein